jgi:hypothetical protein
VDGPAGMYPKVANRPTPVGPMLNRHDYRAIEAMSALPGAHRAGCSLCMTPQNLNSHLEQAINTP